MSVVDVVPVMVSVSVPMIWVGVMVKEAMALGEAVAHRVKEGEVEPVLVGVTLEDGLGESDGVILEDPESVRLIV